MHDTSNGTQRLNYFDNDNPQYLLSVRDTFDDTDLTAIDATAVVVSKSQYTNPDTSEGLGFWVVSTAVGTFVADAKADSKVLDAAPDETADGSDLYGHVGINAPQTYSASWRIIAASLDKPLQSEIDNGSQVMWHHDQLDTDGADALNVDGTGTTIFISDFGLACTWQYKSAIIASDMFSRSATNLATWRGFLHDFTLESDVLVNTGEYIDFKVDGAAVTVTFDAPDGPYDDMFKIAAKINDDLTGGFCDVNHYDVAGYGVDINDPVATGADFGGTKGLRLLIGSSSNMAPNSNPNATLEIVGGSGGTLEKIGLEAELAVVGETVWATESVGDSVWFKYMKPVFPHPAMDASNFDLDKKRIFHDFVLDGMWPKRWFAKDDNPGFPIPPGLDNVVDITRQDGTTSDSATREFVIDDDVLVTPDPVFGPIRGVNYSLDTLVNVGMQEGDFIIIKPGTIDEFKVEIEEVKYARGNIDNVANTFKLKASGFDKDGLPTATWPAAIESATGLAWDLELKDPLFPYYDMTFRHTSQISGTIVGQSSKKYRGLAQGAKIAPAKLSSSIPYLIECYDNALTEGIDMMCFSSGVNIAQNSNALVNFVNGPNGLDKLSREYERAGGICVASAGNDGTQLGGQTRNRYPQQLTDTIGVSALGPLGYDWDNPPGNATVPNARNPDSTIYDSLAFYTTTGSFIDVSAPGGNLDFRKFANQLDKTVHDLFLTVVNVRALEMHKDAPTTFGWPHDLYFHDSGTSIASPVTAAVLARILQALGNNFTSKRTKANAALAILKMSSDKNVGPAVDNKTVNYGHGRVHMRKAVEMALLMAP